MTNVEVAYDGYIDETICLNYSYIDNNELIEKINKMNNVFNKIREIEIGISSNKDIFKYNRLTMSELHNDKDFIDFYNNNYDFDLKNLLNTESNLRELTIKIKKNNKEYLEVLDMYNKKLLKLKKILEVSYDVLSDDFNDSDNMMGDNSTESSEIVIKNNDEFYEEYKRRLNTSINKCIDNISSISKMLNYNYNIFQIIRKVNEKEDILLKYSCLICHANPKDSFLDCGHTYCKSCLEKIPNLICPYCSVYSKKINKLYLN
tara:strand:+ start:305 stop:1087 length:783 start_codon:yes stop_codon:yes gene_type:complete